MRKKAKAKTKARRKKPSRQPEWGALKPGHLERSRERLGLSKAAWVKRLGVPISTYQSWLSGRGVPNLQKQRALLRHLDAATGLQLLRQTDAQSTPLGAGVVTAPRTPPLSPEVQETLRAFALSLLERDLPPAEIPALVLQLRKALS